MSITPSASSVRGQRAEDRSGAPLGTVEAVFLDDSTGELGWLVVGDDAVVPARGADASGGRLRLPVDAESVATAPRLGGREHLDPEHLAALRAHYGAATGAPATGRHAADAGTQFAGNEVAGGQVGGGRVGGGHVGGGRVGGGRTDDAMTLSEERFEVSTDVTPYSRAVLRIETVTEEVMVPVRVTRQQARVEYLPPHHESTAQATGPAGRAGEQATGWVTLWGEEPVVDVQRVPLERVRLTTSWIQEQQQVTAQVRREELALEDDTRRG